MSEYVQQKDESKKKKKNTTSIASKFEAATNNSTKDDSSPNGKKKHKKKGKKIGIGKQFEKNSEGENKNKLNRNSSSKGRHKKPKKIQAKGMSPVITSQPLKTVVTPRKHQKDHKQRKTIEELENGMKESKVLSHSEWYYENSLTEESVMESVNSLSGDRLSFLINTSNRSPSEVLNNTNSNETPNGASANTSIIRSRPVSLIRTSSKHSTKFSWDSDTSSVSLFSPSEKKELETQFALMEETWHSEWVNNMDADHSFTNIKEYNALNSIPEEFDLDEKQEMD